MIKIGLTGSIGSGKSSISSYLKDKGVCVIDADIISREIYEIYSDLVLKIREAFGCEYVENGVLNRKKMASLVFSQKDKKSMLESIVMPYIFHEIDLRMKSAENRGEKCCVLDAPTLMENNLHEKMDYNILVYCNLEKEIERVMKRDGICRDDVLKRLACQLSVEEKMKKSDFILDNSFSLEDTYASLKKIFSEIGVEI
ncbi:dephospho-CoA kinase [Hathewaya proteolytica DSM 3090]|uniref:Dephospho-CoA kinase n=1 Tax=Hathewaya proteolytica DSM 3090 TaxID=1121331 RepID=A0A1M6LDW2_9CLOT|nr:dephospho-CoA kinase [Hathewaya proteolytica]SHJ69403.1 dephospho-CoA kinase [Hathewaya proteolytica DSM 3090]